MLLHHVSTLGGHLQVELRNLFYISVFAVLFISFALGIPYALQTNYERWKNFLCCQYVRLQVFRCCGRGNEILTVLRTDSTKNFSIFRNSFVMHMGSLVQK